MRYLQFYLNSRFVLGLRDVRPRLYHCGRHLPYSGTLKGSEDDDGDDDSDEGDSDGDDDVE